MDPSLPDVQDHCVRVVLDIVDRYDIDGIHMDDYFYPYPSYNGDEDFPDGDSYALYQQAGGTLARDDWRRSRVDALIERLYREIKRRDPAVEFSLSPFGIWRPGHPPGIQGFDPYASLYADARKWLNEGWADIFIPQLYWPISRVPQSFPVLLGWWHGENLYGRHIWPGTSVARMKGAEGAVELTNQVMVARGMSPANPGLCLFSAKWLLGGENPLARALSEGPYAGQALAPASPWLGSAAPPAPRVSAARTGSGLRIAFAPVSGERPFLWLVQIERGGSWTTRILPGREEFLDLPGGPDRIAVRAVSSTRARGPTAWVR